MILCLTRTVDASWQRLFQEIAIWRRLSHPNVLPVLGICPKLFPLCIISDWVINGNILDFTSANPEVNRLRLVRRIFFSSPILTLKHPRSSLRQRADCSTCIR